MAQTKQRVELATNHNTPADEPDVINRRLVEDTFRRHVARHLVAAGAKGSYIEDLYEVYNLKVLDTGSPTRAANGFIALTDAVARIVDAGAGGAIVDEAIVQWLGGYTATPVAIIAERMADLGLHGPVRRLVAEHAFALLRPSDRTPAELAMLWREFERLGAGLREARKVLGAQKTSASLPELVNAWMAPDEGAVHAVITRLAAKSGKTTMGRALAQAQVRAD